MPVVWGFINKQLIIDLDGLLRVIRWGSMPD